MTPFRHRGRTRSLGGSVGLAWPADFTDGSYPKLYDAAIAQGRRRQTPLLQRAQAAAQSAAGQATPTSPSSSAPTVSTVQAAPPGAATVPPASGQADQAAVASAAAPQTPPGPPTQRAPSGSQPRRHSSYPATASRRGSHYQTTAPFDNPPSDHPARTVQQYNLSASPPRTISSSSKGPKTYCFWQEKKPVKAPPRSVIDQAASDGSCCVEDHSTAATACTPAPVPRAAAQRAAIRQSSPPPTAIYKQAPPAPQETRYKAAPAPQLPVKPASAAAKRAASGSNRSQFGAPQQEARQQRGVCLDGAIPLTVAAQVAFQDPIEIRIVSHCQARDTRESTLLAAGRFSNVCNNSSPFGDVVLTWQRVGWTGKAAALAQLGACVIVDDNNAVLKECRNTGAFAIGVGRKSRLARCPCGARLEKHRRLLRPARTLEQNEYVEEPGRRPHSARGGNGLFR